MFFLIWLLTTLLLVTGTIRYIIGAIMELQSPLLGAERDYSLQPTVMVAIPCYNEGEAVYGTIKSISEATYPDGKLEIVVVDDHSNDRSWDWIQRAIIEFPHVKALRNAKNLGKTRTVLRAIDSSESDMIVIVDSDTLIAKDAILELMSCFSDPKMGCVGAPAGLRNPNVNSLTAFQTQLYYLASRIGKRPESAFRLVGCIGGYLLATRRSVFNEVRPEIEKRNWYGVKVKDGEDRFITHQILLRGYRTYVNMNAHCWTNVPDTFKKFFGQQLRWYRSAIRDFFYTIRTLPRHIREVHLFVMYAYFLVPLVVFVSIIKVVQAFCEDPLFWAEPYRMMTYIGLAFTVTAVVNWGHPEQRIYNPFKLLAYGVWWVVNTVFLMPYAMFTLDSDGWGNRDLHLLITEKSDPNQMETK